MADHPKARVKALLNTVREDPEAWWELLFVHPQVLQVAGPWARDTTKGSGFWTEGQVRFLTSGEPLIFAGLLGGEPHYTCKLLGIGDTPGTRADADEVLREAGWALAPQPRATSRTLDPEVASAIVGKLLYGTTPGPQPFVLVRGGSVAVVFSSGPDVLLSMEAVGCMPLYLLREMILARRGGA